jgi:hypothetical protein
MEPPVMNTFIDIFQTHMDRCKGIEMPLLPFYKNKEFSGNYILTFTLIQFIYPFLCMVLTVQTQASIFNFPDITLKIQAVTIFVIFN